MMSAGEVSGDIAGAHLAAALLDKNPEARIFGVGGSRMTAAGVTILCDTNRLGSVGITEAIYPVFILARVFSKIRRCVKLQRPDAAVLIGNDVFNLLLARWLKWKGIRTISYFPPQVWLWRSLARPIARSFNCILTSFPEEQAVYERAGRNATYVGHYLCDHLVPPSPNAKAASRAHFGISPGATVVGLLPGSRIHEVAPLTPVLLDAALDLSRKQSIAFVLPVAEPCYRDYIEEQIIKRGLSTRVLLCDDSHEAMRVSDLLLMASGTASLEAALLAVPMMILYPVSSVTFLAVKMLRRFGLIDSLTIGLPNLILGKRVVPELRQNGLTPRQLASLAGSLLQDRQRQSEMSEELKKVRTLLGEGPALEKAASIVLEHVEN
ncbi:MAG TPA: lipid-A-disaccharide synthase, partial [Acidobacteriota bacterium]|nr:lipid-A-disaccharide synthase [Acidobacteriota bacterium]